MLRTFSRQQQLLLGLSSVAAVATFYYYRRSATMSTALSQESAAALSPSEFRPFTLKSVEDYNYNTKILKFALDDEKAALNLPVASCLVVRAEVDGKQVIRPYTPIHQDVPGELHLLIKSYPAGTISKYTHTLKAGDKLEMKGPFMKIDMSKNNYDEIGMIAGGTGITPMLQVIEHLLSSPNNKTKMTLLFANVKEEDILLREEIEQLQQQHRDRFRVVYVLNQPPSSSWNGEVGNVNDEMIKKYMPSPSSSSPSSSSIFVCGPPGMMNAISGSKQSPTDQGELKGYLQQLGYDKSQVYKF